MKEWISPEYIDFNQKSETLNEQNPQIERSYEKPTIIKQEKMNFPLDILNSKYSEAGYVCKQCSSCHSCR